MSTIEKSIEVNVPEYTAYAQWMKFEEFPQFMEGVKEVTRLDGKRFHWKAEIAGQEKEWESEITEAGGGSAPCVDKSRQHYQRMGHDISPARGCQVKIMLQVEYDSSGLRRSL